MTIIEFPEKTEQKCSIETFFHCKQCMDEVPDGESPMSYQRIQAGWTEQGLQVWCRRHEENIIHIDFEGSKHICI